MANKIPQSKSSGSIFDSEQEAIQVLRNEGKKLADCCRKVWRQYLASYTPKQYVRTGRSLDSIRIGKIKVVSNNEIAIEVTFRDDLAYHDSVFGSNHPKGHAIMLISFGWRVKKGRHRDVEHFGYYQGYDYLGKVQKLYDRIKDKRISLDIQWQGSKNYTKAR